ncbi:hypothetical protein [Sphingobium limneticum]|uniref:Uncharacterized protein n=1 Tax=Sphingobium limneticum TaxID=1007511 RepID=A0A5J5I3V7_9SPHN|nr:hypothetical protein [Sphingobium limneticum]KAA9018301.1 hypothetical protein F4U96_09320 [Sphingobium limneticum]KAA9030937.1 hypothetical protein F4U95_09270 [Sphingobium limneticum]
MVNFVTPSRYDQSLADKGISIAVEEAGNYYGTFDVKCYDAFSPFFKVARERYDRVHKAAIKLLKSDQEKSIHQFVHLAMFGWSDINDENGPVKFTKELAFEYLTQTEVGLYVFAELYHQASNIENFKAVPEEELVEAPEEDPDAVDPMLSADTIAKN